MRKTLALGLFVFGVVLAACGGGGKSGLVPAGPVNPAPVTTPSSAKSTKATLVFHIPAASAQQARTRRPFYITSSTQSVGILVAPGEPPGVTPSPLPTAQVFPVSTPSPCASASSGGEICTFTVVAPIGNDFFVVSTYATAGPNTSTVPLSFAEGEATVSLNPSPGASPLSFALNAVVASVTITVPSPDPNNTPNTQVFTAGVPASPVPLTIMPKDANGNAILFDPTTTLANAVTIQISPPPNTTGTGGFQLGLTPQCSGVSAESGPDVGIACAADFNNVTLSYTGAVSADTNGHVIDDVSIIPVAAYLSSPAPAYAVLQSNVISYPITSFSGYDNGSALQALSDGTIAYLVNAGEGWGIGTFAPSSGTLNQPTVGSGQYVPTSFAISSDLSSVWVVDENSKNLECWTSISSISGLATTTVAPVAPDTFSIGVVALTIDGSGNLWYVGTDGESDQAYAGHFPAAANCGTGGTVPVAQVALNGDSEGEYSENISAFQNGIAYNAGYSNGVYVVTTLSGASVNGVQPNNTGASDGGVAVTANATVYAGFTGPTGTPDVEWLTSPYAGPMTTLADLVPNGPLGGDYSEPSSFSVTSNATGAADRLAYAEEEFSALGVVDSVQSSPVPSLVALPNANDAYGTAFAKDGSIFTLYQDTGSNFYLARALLTKTWSVPVTSLSGNCQGGVFTVDQLGANSGPFTITLSPSLSPATVPGTTAAMFMGVPGGSSATGTATVTDANNRSKTYPITYLASGNGC